MQLFRVVFVAMLTLATWQGTSLAAQLVMVDYPGCSWCFRFNATVASKYSSTALGRIAPLRRINILQKWPSDLRNIRRAYGAPTFILVSNGSEVGRFGGFSSPQVFWQKLGSLVARLPKAADKTAGKPATPVADQSPVTALAIDSADPTRAAPVAH